ncbi:MAG: PASTA domain-containing protein [Bacteroidetes bacterium]|nr:PASTA domain-containing protein [Bacteroidota bacterium]
MIKFLLSKTFLVQLALAIVVVSILIWSILKFIDGYTHNGQTITVPLLEGLTVTEVEELLKDKNLSYEILDSVYLEKAQKGVVLEQSPEGNDLVKENRTIYITVSKITPPKISLPDVVDMSQRLAVAKLESYGLKVGRLDYTPSECLNCVVKMSVRGKQVFPEDLIAKGSTVNLTLGSGTSNEQVLVPYLVNLTKDEAIAKLQETFLNIGAEIYEDCKTKADSASARVYRQTPNDGNTINMGASVDVWLTNEASKINYNPPSGSDSLNLPN